MKRLRYISLFACPMDQASIDEIVDCENQPGAAICVNSRPADSPPVPRTRASKEKTELVDASIMG